MESLMDAEERINRMEKEALITPVQARQLRAGIQLHASYGRARKPSRRSWPLYIAAFVAIIGVTLIFIILGEQHALQYQTVTQTMDQVRATEVMDKTLPITIATVFLLIMPVLLLTLIYNSLVKREESVFRGWAVIENQYHKRSNLVPAIIELVTRDARRKQELPGESTSLRDDDLEQLARAVDVLASDLEPLGRLMSEGELLIDDQSLLRQVSSLQTELGKDLARFMTIFGKLLNLGDSERFNDLTAQLATVEGRIGIAGRRFSDAINTYNTAIRRLPGALIAGLGNFNRKAYFDAENGAGTDSAKGS
jgi:LemA protein